jgi:hypothetical protein
MLSPRETIVRRAAEIHEKFEKEKDRLVQEARTQAVAQKGTSRSAASRTKLPIHMRTAADHRSRGHRVETPESCGICRKSRGFMWDYGDCVVCDRCKPRYLDRVNGKIDAMDRSVSGGRFEGNRFRH